MIRRATHPPAAATPMAFARAIALACRRRGRDPAGLLAQAQITPTQLLQPAARITARQMELLSAGAMRELDDEGLAAFDRPLPWGSYGMLARASLTAPTLGVALKRWCRHHGLLTSSIRLEIGAAAGGTAVVALHEPHGPLPAELRELSIAFVLRNIHGLACWYIDSRIPLEAVRLPFPAPPHADAYAVMFPGCALAFDAAGAGPAQLHVPAQYLALPLRRDERALAQMLQRALPLTVLQYRRDRLLVPQVRQLLASQPRRAHNAESIAQALHLSPRTLHRQLREEGASLQQLKDQVRLERARELLLRTDRPVKQVAEAVGFRNDKSFSRAFRAWAGVSPGGLRETPAGSA